MPNIFETVDYAGNSVYLDQVRFESHICAGHPEMIGAAGAIQLAIEDPSVVVKASHSAVHKQGERRTCCRLGALGRYSRMYVVAPIEYSPDGNWVVTAYISGLPPNGEVLYVRPRL